MKRLGALILSLVLSGPLAAFAQADGGKNVLSCATSDGAVSMMLTVHADTAADFLILSITDKEQSFRMFNQVTKGDVETNLATGSLLYMLLDENFSQDGGVVRNAGVFVVNTGADGAMSGLLMAHSNIYQIACKAP